MSRVAVGTVVATNYLPFARVLADSIRQFHPTVPVFVLVTDGVPAADEPFTALRLEDLGIPDLPAFRGRHSWRGLLSSAKPYLLRHLLDRGFAAALHLDADGLVLADLSDLLAAVERHPVTLCPHWLTPPAQSSAERVVLVAGTFNGGVVGASTAGRSALDWWATRAGMRCDNAPLAGVYYDQRWLDLLPVFEPGTHILRDPGVNVAYWNLADRPMADGCRYFHFSGYDPGRPDELTSHAPQPTFAEVGRPVADLFDRYRELVLAAGYVPNRGPT